MNSFVLIYERSTGDLEVETFGPDERSIAFARRLRLQRSVGPGTEVIVFHADHLDDVRATHGRYFENASELVHDAAS